MIAKMRSKVKTKNDSLQEIFVSIWTRNMAMEVPGDVASNEWLELVDEDAYIGAVY